MGMIVNLLIVLMAFAGMECIAWLTHKYIMHGFMWHFHQDHHRHNHKAFFEKNDLFFLIFAIPSWLCIMFGMMHGNDFKLYIGIGILLYGMAYFVVHDVIIHQRFKWFSVSSNPYVTAIRKAHKIHHKHTGKEHGENFGMLIVPFKYFKEKLRASSSVIVNS